MMRRRDAGTPLTEETFKAAMVDIFERLDGLQKQNKDLKEDNRKLHQKVNDLTILVRRKKE